MRYDKKIFFVKNGEKAYNVETGNYITAKAVKIPVYASVSSTSIQTQKLVYGSVKNGSVTLHIQNTVLDPFDRIEMDGKTYLVDMETRHRMKQAFVCHEG